LRFQVFNDDEQGGASAGGDAFTITRPYAKAHARVHAATPVVCAVGRHDLPEGEGVHPFVEATSPASAAHELLTVCTATPTGSTHGALDVTRTAAGWRVSGMHRGLRVAVSLDTTGTTPVVTVG
jgi:hypothetical protein